MIKRLVMMLLLLAAAAGLPAAHAATGVTWSQDGEHVVAVLNWCELEARAGCDTGQNGPLAERPRIDTSSQVAVHVTGFNFLHYNLEFAVEEKQIEAYAYLAGIWDEILGFDLRDLPAAMSGPAADWWKLVRRRRQELAADTRAFAGQASLDYQELKALTSLRTTWQGRVEELDAKRADAYEQATTVVELQQFDIVDRDHQELLAAINSFVTLAGRSLQGSRQNVGKKKAGTVVTVVATPKPLPATTVADPKSLKSRSVEYLVESKNPLLFHVGLTHSSLEDAEFTTVRALDGRDLFTKVKDEKGTDAFSAYLSYPLGTRDLERAKWFATLGTDLSDVGDRIYAGLSARLRGRWFLTVGGAYGLVTEGMGESTEAAGGGETSRRLFEIIQEDREWAGFAAVSVKVY